MVAAAQELPWSWCENPDPIPMISFHGTADPIVPHGGGASHASPTPFPSVETWTANWANRNRCSATPTESAEAPDVRCSATPTESAEAPDVTQLEYKQCAGGAGVVLYTIHGGGHSWPGGEPMPEWLVGSTSNGVDATA